MNKKNIILGIILVLLIGLAYFYQGPFKSWQINKNLPVNFLAKLPVEQIDQIAIGDKAPEVLVKQSDNWYLLGKTNQLASSTMVQNLLDQLKQVSTAKVELVSANQAKKIDFQTDDSGTPLVLSANKQPLASFVVGKPTADYSSTYFSQSNSNDTYAFSGVGLYSALMDKAWITSTSTPAKK